MSKMFFVVCEQFSIGFFNKKIYDLLDISYQRWNQYKSNNNLSTSCYFKLCDLIGEIRTTDDETISKLMIHMYFGKKRLEIPNEYNR